MEEWKNPKRLVALGFHVYQDSWTLFLGDRTSDLYVKMSQVIQEIDMLSQFEIS